MKRQCHPQETVQKTLDWKSVPQMPRVRTTDGHVMDWDRHAIVAQLLKETQLSKQFYRIDPITEEEAGEIAKEVEVRIKKIGLKHLSGPLVRELVNIALLERGHPEWRNISTRVGTPVYDAHQIDVGSGFEANENANLQDNAETSHKKKADKISKEQYLLLLPPKLADSHLNGDIHIHDLEYLGTRSFCMDWDLRYFFYYGLMPDGNGTQSSVAGPAKKAEVAVLHAVKALGSAQTNFSVAGDEDVLVKYSPSGERRSAGVRTTRIDEFVDGLMQGNKTSPIPEVDGEFLDITDLGIKAAAFNPDTLKIEYKTINRIIRHPARDMMHRITTRSGRMVSVTGAHSLFILDEGVVKPILASVLEAGDYLVIPKRLPADADAAGGNIDLISSLLGLPDELIADIYVIGVTPVKKSPSRASTPEALSERIAATHAHELKRDWVRRDRIPLHFIKQNSIKIDAGSARLGMSRSPHTIPAIIKTSALPALARLLGYFAAEGHITNDTERHVYSTVLSFGSHEVEIIEDAKTCIRELFEMDVATRKPHPTEFQLVLSNKLVGIIFSEVFGTGMNSKSKRIPPIIFNTTKENKLEFLAGYYCDGSMHRREISYKTVTENLASDLLYLLLQMGIVGRQKREAGAEHAIGDRTIRSSMSYRTAISGRDNIEQLARALPLSMNDFEYSTTTLTTTNPPVAVPANHAGIRGIVESTNPVRNIPELTNIHTKKHLAPHRVKKLLSHIRQTVELSELDKKSIEAIETIADGDLGFDIVESIEQVQPPTKYVYDLSIDGYENFVGGHGGVMLHNSGGQGFYNFLTFLAPYLEGMSYEEIEQLMQMFVYEMTQMMVARGGQPVFSSVQLAPGVPKLWRNKPIVYRGRIHNGDQDQAPLRTYGEFEREVRTSFKALMNVMLGGDYWDKPFNFPKPEISIEPDFMKEDEEFNAKHPDLPTYSELYDLTFELSAKFGAPYFDNQIPEYRGAGEGISCYQCCAYNFSSNADTDDDFDDKLIFKDGKHFSMGAWQVISVNCPRAAYRANRDDEALFNELKRLMDIAVQIHKIKRGWMNQIVDAQRMPFATQRPLDPITMEKGSQAVDLEGLVYEIGVVGINEMVHHHTGHQLHESKDAWKLAIRAMTEMEFYSKELSEEHGMTIALARTPAETTAGRFAVADILDPKYSECAKEVVKGDLARALASIHETRDLPIYYTNGTHVPPGAGISLAERIGLEHVFFPIVDGGNIMHIFLGESTPDPKGLRDFAMRIANNTQTGYFAFTRDMTICTDCSHLAPGLKDECPNCGSTNVEQMSRVTGYLQAVSGWNAAKKQELEDRKRYGEADMV
ncbi:MAG: anaerobic ribonucleoside-triphosphate reductase [Euryarchaeota archaeon]|nr:anaerobic ribonucleoside-triphosphate reductase [Euryarchaeota archaeon]